MVGGGSGGTGDWEIGSMAVAGARPPGTRKGYAAVRGTPPTADAGRRPLQGVLSTEEPMKKKGIQAASLTKPATAERGIRQVDKHQPPSNYAA